MLRAANPTGGEQFGYAVALSADGQTLAVGAPMNNSAAAGVLETDPGDTSSFSSGAVRVFVQTGTGWYQEAFIKASNTGLNDQFGSAVALSADGNTLAVSAVFEDGGADGPGADGNDNSVSQSGAVYVFARSEGTWSEAAYIKASNAGGTDDGDSFGYSISLSGDGGTLAAGAPGEDSAVRTINGDQTDDSAMGSGAVYVFARDAGGWSQQAYVKNSNTTPNVLFGYAVALDAAGDSLAASAYDEDRGSGAVYVFARRDGEWSEEGRLRASNSESQDSMGVWLDLSEDGNILVAGAPDEDSLLTGVSASNQATADQETNTSAGAAYVFSREDGGWAERAFLKAVNSGVEDWFGFRLALSGDGNVLAVGAPNEDNSAREIGAAGDDDLAQEAGAVHIFRRDGIQWRFEAYVKGSNTVEFDEFGSALALDRTGTTLAVGARFGKAEDSILDSGTVSIFRP